MKNNTFGKLVLGGSFVVAIIIMLASCVFVAWKPEQPAPFDLISEEEVGCVLPLPESSDPLLATKCLTCGIHFTHPSYGEHIKTCCP